MYRDKLVMLRANVPNIRVCRYAQRDPGVRNTDKSENIIQRL